MVFAGGRGGVVVVVRARLQGVRVRLDLNEGQQGNGMERRAGCKGR